MTKTLSFKRDYFPDLLSIIIPSKYQERARVVMKECDGNRCERWSIGRDVKEVAVRSENGLMIDIEKPHEFRFSFEGDHHCEKKDDKIICDLGDPVGKKAYLGGELEGKRTTDVMKLHNLPVRYTFMFKAPIENLNNHWYMDDLMFHNSVNEINIEPEKVKDVTMNLRHPMLLSANIHFEKKTQCDLLAEPKGFANIREWRKLNCL